MSDHAYELRELSESLSQALRVMSDAVREALSGMRLVSESADEPDQFEHIDDEGDSFAVGPNQHGSFMVNPGENGMPVRLDQDAVNRLARYLDRHRTDQVDTREPDSPAEHWCGSDSDHAEHVSQAQGVPLKCLGAHGGRYGLSPDHLPKPVANPDPMDHWCGRNSDHTAHLYGRDDTELSCSGSREGAYGA